MAPITEPGVIDRIRYLIKRSSLTQAQFARRISLDPANLSKHLSGRLPITEGLINRIVVDLGISKQWLLDGTDVPYSKTTVPAVVNMASVASLPRQVPGSVPVYDIDVTAGTEELSLMFTIDRISGYISLPRISPDSLIVHVSGDSMQPEIIDGGLIAIRPINNLSTIFWGQVYVIVTDDFRRVKYLRKHPTDDSKVILHSANPNYDDIEINRSEIHALFRVEAILNYKVCG